MNSELERRIVDAFSIFDHAGNKTVDAREISTIVRSLGCCPTEAEIQEIIVANEDQDSPGNVHLSDFLPYMVQVITERRFQPASAEKLLEAFKVLDTKSKKFLTRDEITSLMTESGEPLQPDELEEMLRVAIDPESDTFPYEVYINEIMVCYLLLVSNFIQLFQFSMSKIDESLEKYIVRLDGRSIMITYVSSGENELPHAERWIIRNTKE